VSQTAVSARVVRPFSAQCSVCRRSAEVCYAETASKQSKFPGNPDDAIVYLATRGGSQAQAAREAQCCPMKLNRAISALKDCGVWETHIAEIRSRAAAPPSATSEKKRQGELEMPSPKSLGAQISRGANRLGDGRPYGSKGNSWGEYRRAARSRPRPSRQRVLSPGRMLLLPPLG
jgi:hypothetical protein